MIPWYPWLNRVYRQILFCYSNTYDHNILLIHGSNGVGKDSLCYAISRWLMCHKPNNIKSCNVCNSCKLMISGNHPDLYRLQLNKEYQNIGIDYIRTIISNLNNYAYQGRSKIVWISNIECLTTQAANSLLKILEEPPNKTYFLLSCQLVSRLLPTIRSRCICWSILTPDESLGMAWLQRIYNYDLVVIRTALRLCSGSPLSAKKLLELSNWKKRLSFCSILLQAIMNKDMLLLLPILSDDLNNNSVFWLLSFISDALKLQYGSQIFLINDDNHLLIQNIASNWSTQILYKHWRQLMNCICKLHEVNGINRKLLFLHQLLDWEQNFNT